MTTTSKTHLPEIDFLKGLAIISVIIIHTLHPDIKNLIFGMFHIEQAVPVFVILMGFTASISFKRRGFSTIREAYSGTYLPDRFRRILVPFLLMFLAACVWGKLDGFHLNIGLESLAGVLPVEGPGNYFITIVFQAVLVLPLIYIWYQRHPWRTLITLFLISIVYELLAPHIHYFDDHWYLYLSLIFKSLPAFALGFHISDQFLGQHRIQLKGKINWFILVLIPISILYLFMGRFTTQPFPLFRETAGTANFVSLAYPLLLIILFCNHYRKLHLDSTILRPLLVIGRASYHIFLFQIMFFAFDMSHGDTGNADVTALNAIAAIAMNCSLATVLGLLFYAVDDRVIQRLLPGKR